MRLSARREGKDQSVMKRTMTKPVSMNLANSSLPVTFVNSSQVTCFMILIDDI